MAGRGAPTMLEQLLEEINFQRTKEMRQLLKDGEFVILFVYLCHYCCEFFAAGTSS